MEEFPTYEQMVKDIAEKALDEFLYDGKSIREWMKIIGEQEPCADCISRKAVIDVIEREPFKGDALSEIEKMPSVQPEQEQKIGHWIKSLDSYGNNHFTCSQCGNDIATKAGDWDDNYCSICGSYNGGRKNET